MNDTRQKLRGGQLAVWLVSQHQPITFALTARIRGVCTPDQFRQALGKVRLKYPPLSTRVIRESDGTVYLIPDAGLEFPVRIVERAHSSWVKEVTTELARPFDMLNEPPVRFAWLRGKDVSEIIFVCPHALADGFSVAYLARDFLTFLGNPHADVEPMPLTPAMSELISDFPGKRAAIWRAKVKAAMLKLFLGHGPKVGEPPEVDGDSVRPEYRLLPWELTPEQTSAWWFAAAPKAPPYMPP